MSFNNHSDLEGQHAFLGASDYHWINYTPEKLALVYKNMLAKEKGTMLHAYARDCITLKQKLPKSKKTLNLFVNDAIGFNMTPEQPLVFTRNCFGTADAISIRFNKATNRNELRIHDLKTGTTPASMHQLEIYAALFFMEYGTQYKLADTDIELRIYQSNEVMVYNPSPDDIQEIMDKMVRFDKIISDIQEEEF